MLPSSPGKALISITVIIVYNPFSALIYLNYRRFIIRISENILAIKYGKFNYKVILIDNIECCEVTTSFRRYLGVGIRIGSDESWSYNTDLAGEVKLNIVYQRPFVFSSRDPVRISSILTELRKKTSN